ncbi:MAG: division/cell wall cluster transcriptional repressor MraZ [Bacteroidia bacterium]|nr:division/cell wall cluster transcriptional repressor MraZ [Bacteroidia bacterium]
MKLLIGEYACTLDAKGRFLIPSALRKQLPENEQTDFVLNKGLDQCLMMYPATVWQQELEKIQSLNMYETQNRTFARIFLSGAVEVSLDGSDRMLIPKNLMEKAGLNRDIILLAQLDRIEIWDKEVYEKWIENPGFDIAQLAENVMGKK